MKPLHLVGLGLAVIAFDFRLPAFDILADPIGWLALAAGCWRLGTPAGALLGLVGAVASAPWVVLPYHLEKVETLGVTIGGRPTVVESEVLVFDHLAGLRLAAATVAAAVLGVVVWRLLAELARRAAGHRAERTITRLRVLRIAVIVGWIGPMLGAMAVGAISGTGYDPVWDDPAAKLALVADIVALALVAELFIDPREPWALHPAAVRRLGAWSDDVRR